VDDWSANRTNTLRLRRRLIDGPRRRAEGITTMLPTRPRTVTYKEAAALAEKTADAYSFDRYGSWHAVCEVLARRGLTALEIEAVVRSKWTRWAADSSDYRYGKVPARAVVDYLDDCPSFTTLELSDLVHETFPTDYTPFHPDEDAVDPYGRL